MSRFIVTQRVFSREVFGPEQLEYPEFVAVWSIYDTTLNAYAPVSSKQIAAEGVQRLNDPKDCFAITDLIWRPGEQTRALGSR